MSLGSIAVVAYAYFFHHERLSKLVYLGVILAFIGSLFIIGSPILSIGSGSIIGNITLLGAVLSNVVSFFLLKNLANRFSPLYLTYCFFIVSLPFAAPGFVLEFVQNPYWLSNISLSGYLALVYTVLGSSIIAYFFHSYGLKFLSASHASVLGYLSGIIAVLASFVVLKEQLTIPFAIGTIIIIVGLFLAETRHRHTK
jgi:drug/metabolite transporter (DMT)-like permease